MPIYRVDEPIGGRVDLNNGYSIPLIGLNMAEFRSTDSIYCAIDVALAAGYRLIDTAKCYGNEAVIGDALQDLLPKYNLHRTEIFITTKVDISMTDDNAVIMQQAVDDSLLQLQTTYLDLVCIHDPYRNNCESINRRCRRVAYQELENLRDMRKIRSIGVYNFSIGQLLELKSFVRYQPCVCQHLFNMRSQQNGLRKYCKLNSILFQATTISSQLLQLQITNDEQLIVDKYNVDMNTIMLAFVLCQSNPQIGIVPQITSIGDIDDNLRALNVKLNHNELTILNSIDEDDDY